ncbi:hypothetical protein JCM6882_003157 [Rhodosporidiobolus microsporus]
MSTYPHALPSPVIVVGAGCIGLTTGIELLRRGYPVLLIAQHLVGDALDPVFASTAAGAHHLSFADNADWRQRWFDLKTFEKLWQESEDKEAGEKIGVMRLTQTELYKGDTHLRLFEQLPDFRIHDDSQLPEGIEHSVSFTSMTIEPARYLPYLTRLFTSLGGITHRVPKLASLADARKYAKSPLAIVNCTGLGSRSLSDVKDETVHPVRGQVLAVDAPWVKTGWTRQIGSLAGGEGGERTYVIPRASGEVIIGGTRETDDWETSPRPETTDDILRRALQICPSLACPPSSPSTSSQQPTEILRSLVKSAVVGFRPTRDAGVCLEAVPSFFTPGESTPVVMNYGHGGFGWQSCWGCAEEAARIVGEEVRRVRKEKEGERQTKADKVWKAKL